MKLCKRLLKYIAILFSFLCIVAAIQIGATINFSNSKTKLVPADLVVVFPGEQHRIKTGIMVIKNDSVQRFMIISETQEDLQKLLSQNNVPASVNPLPGGKSRSTFEDVYQTVKTMKENQLNSVIVVSSSYHLPRALFLLKVYLTISGQDVHIQGYSTGLISRGNITFKQYRIEVIKFWGSLVEMTGHCFTGKLMLDLPPARKIQLRFKKMFLR